MEILAPITGEVVPISEVPDEVFAEGMAGEGGAIRPSKSGEAVAPASGTLVKLFEGGHAFGVTTEGGVDIIVHLGLDTIQMESGGFEKLANEGDQVEAGQPIVRFDLEEIREAGYDPVSPVVIANSDEHSVKNLQTGDIEAGNLMFEVAD